jgi:hypothetical protein
MHSYEEVDGIEATHELPSDYSPVVHPSLQSASQVTCDRNPSYSTPNAENKEFASPSLRVYSYSYVSGESGHIEKEVENFTHEPRSSIGKDVGTVHGNVAVTGEAGGDGGLDSSMEMCTVYALSSISSPAIKGGYDPLHLEVTEGGGTA